MTGGLFVPAWDDESEQHFWEKLGRLLWSSLILLLALGLLVALTFLLRWQAYLPVSFVGVLAGLALSLALQGSARTRELTGLVLGALILPMLAAYLGGIAARDADAFPTYGATTSAFLAHATMVTLTVSWISQVWRRPAPPAPDRSGDDRSPRTTGAVP